MKTRRDFFRSVSTYVVLLKMGLLFPLKVFAQWPKAAFEKETHTEVLKELFGERSIKKTDKIVIDMPSAAENGAIVPVTIKTDIDNVKTISLLAEKNPIALLAQFSFQGKGRGDFIRTRIKLAKSSNLFVVVETHDQICINQKHIEVLKGGCD
ncbi:MAG: thiosulfate oxidation carrier protein SoxY [Gammaproteobacteria bacterium]